MKKISRKNLLFLTFSFSVLISGAIAIPLGIQARSKTFDAELQSYNEKLEGAINLSNQQNFDQNEFVRIAKNLKIKNEFVSKFSVKDAIDLHFDKFYSFDLNDIVDFSPILAKFPDFKVKLVLPSKKEQVKIEGNSLKNLAINIVNTQKSVNFSTQIDLKFDSSAKKIDIKPENLKLIFKLSNNELTKNKSAVELAIALQKNFSENFRKNKDQVKALFKTLHNFGGISVFREGKDQIILPSNFEIKPKLENERLIFSNVDNVQPKLELLLSLFDKNTMKERDFLLEFTNFSKISDVKYGKIEEIFKKNYTFKTDLARVLTFFNLTPS